MARTTSPYQPTLRRLGWKPSRRRIRFTYEQDRLGQTVMAAGALGLVIFNAVQFWQLVLR